MCRRTLLTVGRLVMVLAVAMAGLVSVHTARAAASTGQFRGVNWADQRDNFVDGVLYVSGLGPSDTHASAATVADRVVGQMYSITGANTVRMPINEPTVSNYWGTYTGAIDTALTKGKVILAYWAHSGGKPADMAAFNAMWDQVIGRYGNNPNAYFEVINEPHGYSDADLDTMYSNWLDRYSRIPRDRVILDGAGFAQDVAAVGDDSRLDGTLLAVHDYSFFVNPPFESETQWANHIADFIGGYASRTIATEWGGPQATGSKNNVHFDPIDYSIPSGSFMADYIRGVSSELRSLGMGSVYWPGLRDGDWYSMTSRSGSGADTKLSLVNPTGLTRLHYAWGIGDGGGTYVRIRNVATGSYIDGMDRTADGAAVGQDSDSSTTSQQWVIQNDGNFVRIVNRATGLYLDGMGRTSDGADVGQFSDTNSANQQWAIVAAG